MSPRPESATTRKCSPRPSIRPRFSRLLACSRAWRSCSTSSCASPSAASPAGRIDFVSLSEERRARLDAAMDQAGLDALLVYGNGWQCDYLRYLSDFGILE